MLTCSLTNRDSQYFMYVNRLIDLVRNSNGNNENTYLITKKMLSVKQREILNVHDKLYKQNIYIYCVIIDYIFRNV